MIRFLLIACTAWLGLTLSAQARCNGNIRFSDGQSFDGYLTAQAGKQCRIRLGATSGPVFSTRVTSQPKHGHAGSRNNMVGYTPTLGYAGPDSFDYEYAGNDTHGNPTVRRIHLIVTVVP